MRKIVQLILFFCGFSAGSLWAVVGKPVTHGPLTMHLVHHSNGVVTDHSLQTIWIGWIIQRDPGWHTYWKHPGDVGLAPTIKWDLPDEYSAGNLIFSPPQKVSMSGITAHGHTGKTLFLIPLTLSSLPQSGKLNIRGQFSWMACSNICMPATTELSLNIPIVEQIRPDPVLVGIYQKFWEEQPKIHPETENFYAQSVGKFIRLQFPSGFSRNLSDLEFFPEDRVVRSNQKPMVRQSDGRMEWLLEKSPWASTSPAYLSGLLTFRRGGNLQSYRLELPVKDRE